VILSLPIPAPPPLAVFKSLTSVHEEPLYVSVRANAVGVNPPNTIAELFPVPPDPEENLVVFKSVPLAHVPPAIALAAGSVEPFGL
jgi:hypothetical protein